MKKLLTFAMVGYASMFAMVPVVNAAQTTQGFNVNVTLTPKCEINSVGDVNFVYTSFQVGASAATGGAVSLRCTNTKPYEVSLDAYSGTVIGLAYSLTIDGVGADKTGVTGSGLTNKTHTLGGSMAGGQAGNCGTAVVPGVGPATDCTGSTAHTLTVTY